MAQLTLVRGETSAVTAAPQPRVLARTAPATRIRQRADEALTALDQAASPAGRDAAR